MGPEIRQALTCDTDQEEEEEKEEEEERQEGEEEEDKDPETYKVRTSFHFPRNVKYSLNLLTSTLPLERSPPEKHPAHATDKCLLGTYHPLLRARPRFSPAPRELIGDTLYDQVT